VHLEYNVDGSLKSKTDQRETVIDYTYTSSRQPEFEKVTTLGGNTDGHVRSIKREYDNLDRLEKITSYETSGGTGTVRNQIKYSYDTTHGKLIKTEQSHESAVTSGTPAVQYAYDNSEASNIYANVLRQKSTTYPNGRIIHLNYNTPTTVDAELNRIFMYEADSSGSPGTDLTLYSYNGTSRLVLTADLVPAVQSSSVNIDGAGADNYNGFDRFGREVIKEWYRYASGQWRDRFEYALDFAGNRTVRDVRVDLISGSYPNTIDQKYAYDGLQRLKQMDEGAYSGGTITSQKLAQTFTLDQLGNWPQFVQTDSGAGVGSVNQTRTHSAANEITAISGSGSSDWVDPVHDLAGNMTEIPQPLSPLSKYVLIYDAWNRLIELRTSTGTLITTNEYDGLGRRIKRVDVAASPDVTYDYYYNEQWQLLEER
jgi:hypothetical protein